MADRVKSLSDGEENGVHAMISVNGINHKQNGRYKLMNTAWICPGGNSLDRVKL